jgi:predicted nucleic acid-binding protein
MTVVVDASAVVAALVDGGSDGQWAQSVLRSEVLVAPHLMPVEAANALRRAVLAGHLSEDTAALAHQDLVQMPVIMLAYEPYARRVWQLRDQATASGAWYIAIAESLDVSLVTLDRRLARAHGATCPLLTPP